MNTTTKTVAERLREAVKQRQHCDVDIIGNALGRAVICDSERPCFECEAEWFNALADTIEAEQAELDKCIEVLESDRDDYIEHVTTFACWQMQIANMLDIPLAERNNSEEIQAKIIAALKERTKAEHDGVDVDALLKLAQSLERMVSEYDWAAPFEVAAKTIRKAVKGAKPQLPEGIEWPRFEDGELVRFGGVAKVHDDIGEVIEIRFHTGKCSEVTIAFEDESTATHYMVIDGPRIKRPEPEVLDADGVPIKVGDTVWHEDEGECVVERIYRQNGDTLLDLDVCGAVWNTANVKPAEVTHRKPDTFKSVVEEMLTDFDSHDTIELDGYFDRLRKLMGGE